MRSAQLKGRRTVVCHHGLVSKVLNQRCKHIGGILVIVYKADPTAGFEHRQQQAHRVNQESLSVTRAEDLISAASSVTIFLP